MDINEDSSLATGKDVFTSFSKCLQEKLDEINAQKEDIHLETFDKVLHWHKLELCFQNVSKECTKLAVIYSKPPIPSNEERKCILESVLLSLDLLWKWYIALPVSQGRALKLMLRRNVKNVFESVQDLMSSVQKEGCSESQARLQATGKIWKYCESFNKIPNDNKAAALSRLCESYQLLGDALAEIEQEINNDIADFDCEDDVDDDDVKWTAKDKPLLQPCLGLIKTGKGTLKRLGENIKSKGLTTSLASIDQLDKTVDSTENFSTCVDDLVVSFYPPVDHVLLIAGAKSLVQEINDCLTIARHCHYTEECDTSWLDFLSNAVQHNMKNLLSAVENT